MATATKNTSKPQTAKTEPAAPIKESINGYLDQLIERHEQFAGAVTTVRGRNARVIDKFLETVIGNQREALELGKTVLGAPTAYAQNMEAVMASMTNVQERTLDLAKTVYREQAEAAASARSAIEPLVAAGGNLGKPFEKMTAMWAQAAK